MIDSWMEFCTHELEVWGVGDGAWGDGSLTHPGDPSLAFVVQGASLHLGAASDAAMICWIH